MANVLVVTGSVRPNSANAKVVPLVVAELEAQSQTVTVADLAELNMPFYDAPLPPASPDFAPEHDSVRQWTQLVTDADAVVFVTPEYNHTLTPVQLNAIDWIAKEWENKLVSLIGYGWTSGAGQAHATAREALAVNLKAKVLDTQANLFFMKDLNPDGSVAEGGEAAAKIAEAVAEVVEKVSAAVPVAA